MRNPLVFSLAALYVVLVSHLASAQDCCVKVAPSFTSPTMLRGEIKPPWPVEQTPPAYPPAARAAGHQGTCFLTLVVGLDGNPHDIQVLRKLDAELDDSAIAAASTWRYQPASREGEALEMPVRVRIHFRLYDSPHRALALLWDRSEENDPQADLELSKNYFEGTGVPQDEDLGFDFLQMAADWNMPQAQFLMGEHFYKNSNPPDYVAAYLWYALSKRSGGKQGEAMLHLLAPEMTAEQLGEAETRIGYWPEEPPRPGH